MICSSTTTSAPERRRPWRTLAALALVATLLAGPGLAAPGADLVADARQALTRGDGAAAESALRRALSAGVARDALAAYMGEALLQQGRRDDARAWLEPGVFSDETAAFGFRQLARLKRLDGDLLAAGQAFDRALAIAPRDAELWVEIGRLRYAGGEHLLAIAAADHALTLDPRSARALEFKGQIVRDQRGLGAALPWFARGLRDHPRDPGLMFEQAATFGDLGRAREMLGVTRQMLAIEPGSPRAYYLQAVLAARAGNIDLARGLLARTRDGLGDMPAALLLRGVLEMRAGNPVLAAEALSRLARAQPANARVAALLARAYALAGENGVVLHDYADAAARPEASPYLMTLVARAHEAAGRRDLAAPLLDRAALARGPAWIPLPATDTGSLLAAGDVPAALALAAERVVANPGSAFDQTTVGDVRLAGGDAIGALRHYRVAARVRLSESLLLRMVAAAVQSGRQDEAMRLVERFLAGNPSSAIAARLAAAEALRRGHWSRARLLLDSLRANGGGGDVALLADLSRAQLRSGDAAAAETTARAAHALQPGGFAATEAWGRALYALGQTVPGKALLAKARATAAMR